MYMAFLKLAWGYSLSILTWKVDPHWSWYVIHGYDFVLLLSTSLLLVLYTLANYLVSPTHLVSELISEKFRRALFQRGFNQNHRNPLYIYATIESGSCDL